MIVMPANNSSMHLGWLAGQYAGRLGWLLSPSGWRVPHRWLPYALDNDAFTAWSKRKLWDEVAYLAMLAKAQLLGRPPAWLLVPDVVADRMATLERWQDWAPRLAVYGWPLAFAVQDGMTQADVPAEAQVIFVGGTTDWKWATLQAWCRENERVHVGRVNGYDGLWACHEAGAESCDGTGWFRGDQQQLAGLEAYLQESSSHGRAQRSLFRSVS